MEFGQKPTCISSKAMNYSANPKTHQLGEFHVIPTLRPGLWKFSWLWISGALSWACMPQLLILHHSNLVTCTCDVKNNFTKLMQFLMGLIESYFKRSDFTNESLTISLPSLCFCCARRKIVTARISITISSNKHPWLVVGILMCLGSINNHVHGNQFLIHSIKSLLSALIMGICTLERQLATN